MHWEVSGWVGGRGWVVGKGGGRERGVTQRARAGTLAMRVTSATPKVHMVSALPFGFLRHIGLPRSKYLPAGLHGSEGAAFSSKNIDAFRSGIVKACWPRKLPMANPPCCPVSSGCPRRL